MQTNRKHRRLTSVRTHRRYVDHTRVVKGDTKLIQENRLVAQVRRVINKEVVVHRQYTVVKDVVLHRTNTINEYRKEYHRRVVNVNAPGTVRHVVEHHRVRGMDCTCDGRYGGGYGGGRVVSLPRLAEDRTVACAILDWPSGHCSRGGSLFDRFRTVPD